MADDAAAGMGLVLDCADPDSQAAFWAAALRYERVGGVGSYVLLVPRDGLGPNLLLQKVPEPKTTKNRMHVDIEIADIEAEARRLEQLGARRLEPRARSEHGSNWFLMTDPEGNEFCVCDGGVP